MWCRGVAVAAASAAACGLSTWHQSHCAAYVGSTRVTSPEDAPVTEPSLSLWLSQLLSPSTSTSTSIMRLSVLVAVVVVAACLVASTQARINLRVNEQLLRRSMFIGRRKITRNSCALEEKCVAGKGKRRLLYFDTGIINDGDEDLHLANSNLFEWSSCHQHFHHSAIAEYEIRSLNGRTAIAGHKQSFCMEDTARYSYAPGVRNFKKYNCNFQGISAGWQDVYSSALDCQFIDITDLPKGKYRVCVILNPDRLPIFREDDYSDNESCIKVKIGKGKRVKVLSDD
eukprot:m.190603 g.190603  ORF g.190603 m.190603 type:complete len:285 (-) comp18237_c0_seq5:1633-2487(-)